MVTVAIVVGTFLLLGLAGAGLFVSSTSDEVKEAAGVVTEKPV